MNFKKILMSAGLAAIGLVSANAVNAQSTVSVTISGLPAGEYVDSIFMPNIGVVLPSAITSTTATFQDMGGYCAFTTPVNLSAMVVNWANVSNGGLTLRTDGTLSVGFGFSVGLAPSLDQNGNLVVTLPLDPLSSPDAGYNPTPPGPFGPAGALTVTFGNLQNAADFSVCFPNASSSQHSSSSPSNFDAQLQSSIQANVLTWWTNWLHQLGLINVQMFERFKADKGNYSTIDDNRIPVMSTRNAPTGRRMTGFNLNADDSRAAMFGSLSFLDAANGWRRVGSGDVSYSDVENVGTTTSLNARMAWERYMSNATLHGYFVGANLSQSNLIGAFGGDQDNLGLSLGTYVMSDLGQGVIASGYAALALNRSDLTLNNGITTVSDGYDTRSLLLGGSVTGEVVYPEYRLRPTLSVNYAHTNVGTLNMTEVTSGSVSELPVNVGTVRLIEVVASPMFLFNVDSLVSLDMDSEFAFAPRVSCERQRASTNTNNCGSGIEFGWKETSRDGASVIDARFGYDEVGGQTRRKLTLSGQLRF